MKLSVVIPFFNVENYIEQCLQSVLSSTFKPIEIICVDNNSTDASTEKVISLQKDNPQIKLLKNTDGYAGASRNLGLKHAFGDYIHFLDADDYINGAFYEIAAETIREKSPDILIADALNISELTGEINYSYQLSKLHNKQQLNIQTDAKRLAKMPVVPWNRLFKRKFLIENNIFFQDFIVCNDRYFSLACNLQAKTICYIKGIMVYHRIDVKNSLVDRRKTYFECEFMNLQACSELLQEVDNNTRDIFYQLESNDVRHWFEQYASDKLFYEKYAQRVSEVILENKQLLKKDILEKYRSIFLEQHHVLISIIIPVFNTLSYLEECLTSVLNQTYRAIEVIIVDDGSTDGSLAYCKNLSQKTDIPFKILEQAHKGQGAARNLGIEHANGEYILFMDSDDILNPQAVESFVLEAKFKDVDIAISGLSDFTGDFNPSQKYIEQSLDFSYIPDKAVFSAKENAPFIFNMVYPGPVCKLFRRSFLLKHKIVFPNLARAEDFVFVFHAFALANAICVINEVHYYRRIRTGSLEQTNDLTPTAFCEAIVLIDNILKDLNVYDLYKQSLINSHIQRFIYGFNSLKEDKSKEQVTLFLKNYQDKLGFYSHPERYFYNPGEVKRLCDYTASPYPKFLLKKTKRNNKKSKRKKRIYISVVLLLLFLMTIYFLV